MNSIDLRGAQRRSTTRAQTQRPPALIYRFVTSSFFDCQGLVRATETLANQLQMPVADKKFSLRKFYVAGVRPRPQKVVVLTALSLTWLGYTHGRPAAAPMPRSPRGAAKLPRSPPPQDTNTHKPCVTEGGQEKWPSCSRAAQGATTLGNHARTH